MPIQTTQLIVCGHGHFASGLVSAATFIAGQRDCLHAIDFVDGMSDEALAEKISECVQSCPPDTQLVFICDLLGGSPYKVAAPWVIRQPERCQLVVGINLGALIDTLLKVTTMDAASCAENLMVASARYLYRFEAPVAAAGAEASDVLPSEGI